jgi:hypothetical protein
MRLPQRLRHVDVHHASRSQQQMLMETMQTTMLHLCANHARHANSVSLVSHAKAATPAASVRTTAPLKNRQSRLCMSVQMVSHSLNGKSNWPSTKAAWAS